MKRNRIGYLSLSFYSFYILLILLLSCNTQKEKKLGSVEIDSNTITRSIINDANPDTVIHELIPYIYRYDDTTSIVHATTHIQGKEVFIALLSEIETIEKEKRIGISVTALQHLKDTGNIVSVNGKQVVLPSIKDSKILVPSYIRYVTFNQEEYIVVELNLISFISGSGWGTLILPIANMHASKARYVQTAGRITRSELEGDIKKYAYN